MEQNKSLKELFEYVCKKNKGSIKISCSGSSGGLYYDTYYYIKGNSSSYELDFDEVVYNLCEKAWDELFDYPEDTTIFVIKSNNVIIETIGQFLEQEDGEEDDDFYERNKNTYELTIEEFSKIYKLL